MKIKILGICLFILLSLTLHAETLTVVNEEENSRVFLNGVFIGQGSISNHVVEPGNYLLTIKKNNDVVFKKDVVVRENDNLVVDASTFVGLSNNSSIIDYAPKQIEEKRIKKATKGPLGIGLTCTFDLCGASLKWNPLWRLGVQTSGWVTNNDDYSRTHYNLRLYTELEDTMMGLDSLYVVYAGVGLGNNTKEYEELPSGSLSNINKLSQDISELFIGFESSTGSNIYWFLEVALHKINKETVTLGGAKGKRDSLNSIASIGAHIYFN